MRTLAILRPSCPLLQAVPCSELPRIGTPIGTTIFPFHDDTTRSYRNLRRRRTLVLQAAFSEHETDSVSTSSSGAKGRLGTGNNMDDDSEAKDECFRSGLSKYNNIAASNHSNGIPLESHPPLQLSSSEDPPTTPSVLGMTPGAIFALNSVAVIWGTQHAVVKMVVDDSEAGPFTLLRFGIGALVASIPLLLNTAARNEEKDVVTGTAIEASVLEARFWDATEQQQPANVTTGSNLNNSVLRWGGEIGFWLFLGFAFQAIGLGITTAQRSGFLLYLNVKFVPFFACIFLGRQISLPTWISALVAFGGTALLAYDGTSWSLNEGDVWSIAAAAASAMYILRLDAAAKAVGDGNSAQLNAACLWAVTLLSGVWSLGTAPDMSLLLPQLYDIATSHTLELLYLSVITTALANYIQTKAQKEVSAERASVIYAMDPVYGAVFSNLLLGETLTSLGFVGAGLITAAAAANALLDLGAPSGEGASDTAAKKNTSD